jgi:hypothetical protein
MSLTTWNSVAAVVHAGLAAWTLSLPRRDVTLFEYGYKANESPASDLDYSMDIRPSGSVDLKALTVGFFAFTALAHVWYATDAFGSKAYSKAVQGFGWNPYRWIEYSVSASLMIYVISTVAGAKEQNLALTATLLTPGLMLQGLTVERELHQNEIAKWAAGRGERPEIDPVLVWFNFGPAWFFFALKWFLIWTAFLKLQSDLKAEGKPLDPKITQLVSIQFVAFSLFGLVQSVQVLGWASSKRGHWAQVRYENYEKAYISLSLLAKAALGISVARLL